MNLRTHKQAQCLQAQVRKGEKGALVQYWKFTDQVPLKDERGKPLLDKEGETFVKFSKDHLDTKVLSYGRNPTVGSHG